MSCSIQSSTFQNTFSNMSVQLLTGFNCIEQSNICRGDYCNCAVICDNNIIQSHNQNFMNFECIKHSINCSYQTKYSIQSCPKISDGIMIGIIISSIIVSLILLFFFTRRFCGYKDRDGNEKLIDCSCCCGGDRGFFCCAC